MYNRVRSMFRKGDRRVSSKRDANRARQRPVLESLETRELLTGTWTKVLAPVPNNDGIGTMLLMSDGTVMANGGQGFASKDWYKLTPDATGSYTNGTWSILHQSALERLDLRLGRPAGWAGVRRRRRVHGAEHGPKRGQRGRNLRPSGQHLDADGQLSRGRAGRLHVGGAQRRAGPRGGHTGNTFIYDPKTNVWTPGPTTLNGDTFGEEGWVKLGDGSTLDYQIEGSAPQTGVRLVLGATDGQDQWVPAGSVPVVLDSNGGNNGIVPELGPGFTLQDGRAFWVGATSNTALYTLPTASNPTGTWTAGPVQLDSNASPIGGFDAPGAVEPNGKVVWGASPIDGNNFPGPTTFLEYDPTANTISRVTSTGPDTSGPGFVGRFLELPSGQLGYTSGSDSTLWLYNPDSPANPIAAPHVTKVTTDGSGTFTLTGTQLNGLSQGAAYGDDAQMASNYPIIKLTNSQGVVKFAKATNWSNAWVGASATPETVNFTLPAGFGLVLYKLNVVTNGVSSTDYNFNTHILGLKATAPTNAFEATTFSSQVATFSDASPRAISAYSASIDWGDGQVTQGSIQAAKGAGNFVVIGSHQYPQGGTYHYTVTVTTTDGANDIDDTDLIVHGLPLSVTTTALQLNEGDAYALPLAHFTDTAPVTRAPSFYTAAINFGDGSSGVGQVVANPGGGFDILDSERARLRRRQLHVDDHDLQARA